MNTMVRFTVEGAFGKMKQRYSILKYIKWHYLKWMGYNLRYITSVHIKYEIGKINTSELRFKTNTFFNMNCQRFMYWHPISNQLFTEAMSNSRSKNSDFVMVKTRNEIKNVWSSHTIDNMLFSFQEMMLKGNGISAVRKGQLVICKSKSFSSLKMYIGSKGKWYGSLIVKGICKNCHIYMAHQSKTRMYT